MNNAESNPTQLQQRDIQAKTPSETPATETARADPEVMARDHVGADAPPASYQRNIPGRNPLPSIDLDASTSASPDPLERAKSRIVSVDNASMEASDNTVDTDGKGLEAKRDLPLQHDNVVGTNATLVNNVTAPARGLGGIDSRPEGNRPSIHLRTGLVMEYHGRVETPTRNGGRVEHLISIAQRKS
ncbi:DUF3005 domain-containing protein [Caballeronia novacaledonica]|uniref:DUF3005 domain-containing protein n=1 Tax=Caballeronia novacaledonica TaxID=1544861 RepID=UPI001EE2F791|nr:DUF3005 domain-containing protein [Caballeronia novacaledonica]GJH12830.1 DUF3005 domain-containing protein [Caballeronia novacaledonica]